MGVFTGTDIAEDSGVIDQAHPDDPGNGNYTRPPYETMYGNGGNDLLRAYHTFSGYFVARFYGGDDDDTLLLQNISNGTSTGNADGYFDGGIGNDLIIGGNHSDVMFGGEDNDILVNSVGPDILPGSTQSRFTDLSSETMHGGGGTDLILAGGGNDLIYGDAGDDTLFAITAGSPEFNGIVPVLSFYGGLFGEDGNDTIDGGTGIDYLDGGNGDDSLVGGTETDTLLGWHGRDTLDGGTGDDFLDGMEDNDRIEGGEGIDRLFGGGGNDTLTGGSGADFLSGGDGLDIVSYVGSTGAVRIDIAAATVAGGDADGDTLLSIEGVTGSDLDDELLGDAGDNVISSGSSNRFNRDLIDGRAGNDSLHGGYGASTILGGDGDDLLTGLGFLDGGDGDDSYIYAPLGQIIGEEALSGYDAFEGGGPSVVLPENIEVGLMTTIDGELHGNAADNTLFALVEFSYPFGNGSALDGGAGSDVLVADFANNKTTLTGGAGQDYFVLNSQPSNGELNLILDFEVGIDKIVIGSALYPSELQGRLAQTGWSFAYGAPYSSLPTGNPGIMYSSEGVVFSDFREAQFSPYYYPLVSVLQADGSVAPLSATDFLVAANLQGTTEGDTYFVDVPGTFISWDQGGIDTVIASIDFALPGGAFVDPRVTYTYTFLPPPEIENLTMSGGLDLKGWGNRLANVMTGNSGDNTIEAGAGNDTLDGAGGDDTLAGGEGADRMTGGAGNDTFYFDTEFDVVVEAAGEGTDRVFSAIHKALFANVENLILEGTANINGSGNELANSLVGNDGANVLDGRAGADRMFGHGGNDTYIVDSAGDLVGEGAGKGTDTVKSTITYTLGANVEKLLLLGATNIDATGNALDNVLVGNNGSNSLNGAAGVDNLTGGLGLDYLTGGLGSDRFLYTGVADSGPTSATRDRILDFTAGDRIWLNAIDANDLIGGDQAFVLDTNGSFSAGEIRQTVFGSNLLIEMNTNANAATEMSILLIGRSTALAAGDFVL
ncbi:MAG: hypothetical protein SFW09_23975 [Hyphomicrobiaceae bacterium]|nr:hypothetical protein [Hyphomicrobiaceae bacterium]